MHRYIYKCVCLYVYIHIYLNNVDTHKCICLITHKIKNRQSKSNIVPLITKIHFSSST